MSRIVRSGPEWLPPMTDMQRENAEAPFAKPEPWWQALGLWLCIGVAALTGIGVAVALVHLGVVR